MRILAALLCAAVLSPGAVRRIYLDERSDVLNGMAFGSAGPYERIKATAHFAVDPKLPANRIITDIDLAPRNADGLVEFSADLYILRPRDPALSNGTLLFEVVNRGNKTLLGTFNLGRNTNDPRTDDEFGDRFLMERGFSLMWLGWQFDVPDKPDLMRVHVPVAKGATGIVRSEYVPEAPSTVMPLAERNHQPYSPADLRESSAMLTVRDTPAGQPRAIARNGWHFSDSAHITMSAGFKPGLIYEAVYTAKDPAIVGLGPTAVRDMISFLKYENSPFLPGDMQRYMKRSIGIGTSQSGRFLRTFLYQGFNADEKGRKVFDGVWAHVAGAGRGSFNHRFAQPSRDGQALANYNWPTDLFPFTDLDETDPESEKTGALLTTAQKQNVVPKIFYTNGSYEYWGRDAALIHTTPDGKDDAPLARDTRVYSFAGTQHGAGRFPPERSSTQYLPNPNDYRWIMRALLTAMNAWLRDDKEPPPSLFPRISRQELAVRAELKMPHVPGLEVPQPRIAYRLDFGPELAKSGVVSVEPPRIGKPYPVLLPQVDADGNEIAGIRLPCIQAPLGTYTGWNLRDAKTGAPHAMIAFIGSFLPFAPTEADRERMHDPRPSIASRYASKADYMARLRAAADSLAQNGYVLVSDVPRMVDQASVQWDYWMLTRSAAR